jgi:hypothetical protein
MTDPFTRLIAKEAGTGGGRGKRTRGPRRRPIYIAHPATWWTPETTAKHLADCRTGRDGNGDWRPRNDRTDGERWAEFWEMSVDPDTGECVGGETHPVEVP